VRKSLTSGRLRALTAVAGLNSGPIGMRILCSKTSFDVNGYGNVPENNFSACKIQIEIQIY
jgi:hypothetical protein